MLLGDDGVGPYVARLLAASYEFEEGVEVLDLGTPALDLIDQIPGKDAVIFIDSIATEDAPGTVRLHRKGDIIRLTPAVRMDPHSPALIDTLLSTELFGLAPDNVLLVGVVGESCEPRCSLSATVKTQLDQVIEEVLRELDRVGVSYSLRLQPAELGIWWTTDEEMALVI